MPKSIGKLKPSYDVSPKCIYSGLLSLPSPPAEEMEFPKARCVKLSLWQHTRAIKEAHFSIT